MREGKRRKQCWGEENRAVKKGERNKVSMRDGVNWTSMRNEGRARQHMKGEARAVEGKDDDWGRKRMGQ